MIISTKYMLNLIKYHCNGDDNAFKTECRSIAELLRSNGLEEPAEYVLAMIGDVPTMSPQDNSVVDKEVR